MKRRFNLLTIAELRDEAKKNPPEYIVDDLLVAGTINAIVGKPKLGKSSLVRQLAVDVSKGQPFLGRPTKKSGVVYLAFDEPLLSKVAEHLNVLGATDGIHSLVGGVDKSIAMECLLSSLEDCPEVKLVIIDTLFKFLSLPDTDKYVDVNDALEKLAALAVKHKVAILFAHHAKKRGSDHVGDSMLGSTAIAGGTCTNIFLDVGVIQTMQRYGDAMEPTALHFNKVTRRSELGDSVEAIRESAAESKRRDRGADILKIIVAHPDGIGQKELREAVGISPADLQSYTERFIEYGTVLREGEGKKLSPYIYFPGKVPIEKAA